MKKKNNLKSKCCKAEIRYSDFAPDFIGDDPKTMIIGTCCYICTKCNQPCDVYLKERKTWIRNPTTKVKEDNREKQKRKEIDKEIKEIGCA